MNFERLLLKAKEGNADGSAAYGSGTADYAYGFICDG